MFIAVASYASISDFHLNYPLDLRDDYRVYNLYLAAEWIAQGARHAGAVVNSQGLEGISKASHRIE